MKSGQQKSLVEISAKSASAEYKTASIRRMQLVVILLILWTRLMTRELGIGVPPNHTGFYLECKEWVERKQKNKSKRSEGKKRSKNETVRRYSLNYWKQIFQVGASELSLLITCKSISSILLLQILNWHLKNSKKSGYWVSHLKQVKGKYWMVQMIKIVRRIKRWWSLKKFAASVP